MKQKVILSKNSFFYEYILRFVLILLIFFVSLQCNMYAEVKTRVGIAAAVGGAAVGGLFALKKKSTEWLLEKEKLLSRDLGIDDGNDEIPVELRSKRAEDLAWRIHMAKLGNRVLIGIASLCGTWMVVDSARAILGKEKKDFKNTGVLAEDQAEVSENNLEEGGSTIHYNEELENNEGQWVALICDAEKNTQYDFFTIENAVVGVSKNEIGNEFGLVIVNYPESKRAKTLDIFNKWEFNIKLKYKENQKSFFRKIYSLQKKDGSDNVVEQKAATLKAFKSFVDEDESRISYEHDKLMKSFLSAIAKSQGNLSNEQMNKIKEIVGFCSDFDCVIRRSTT